MENLNKENFWNEIEARYPGAFEKFKKWIDFYKWQNNWEKIFRPIQTSENRVEHAKFHDIPFELQHGILARFDIETRYGIEGYEKLKKTYVKEVEGFFFRLEREIETVKPTN